ncbi:MULTISPECIES: HAD family hydrolase [unclassified Thermoanaerobacterium]|uniref:HAD family hydrolase n=1 Tax=unclassified Thermoanaerobacterium TaxID=2622527 RepID=UPI000A149A15|nr:MULTISPECIES: HAD family hydrolase [unclassified Thermoanaerobacterium]MDE4541571.1 HAD family hydrolase [Thermoanaerobacterium sp. R66]ORX23448.1 hydrolase [Thermoanaerobacterium sp. PSU-2]
MIDTVMFDLDGTLLPVDTDKMIMEYFEAISNKISDYFDKYYFQKALYSASMDMINNLDPDKTNEEAFFDSFLKLVEYPKDKIMEIFNDFYENDYKNLGANVCKNEYAKACVELLVDKGYDVVLATNPIFPGIAIKERLRWAGIDHKYFSFITSYEHMHFCKPYIQYYKEIVERLEKKPQHCIMIGNDVDEDVIAGTIGFKTYLLDEFLINRTSKDISAFEHGNYKDLYEYIKRLPAIR